jgi:uncharacterized protein (DUF2225 family)
MIDMKEMTIKKIAMSIVTIVGIIRLYSICNAANNATHCVRIASYYRETEKSETKRQISDLRNPLNMTNFYVHTCLKSTPCVV